MKEGEDVTRAKDNEAAVQAQIDELEASLQSDVAALDATYNPDAESLDKISLKPKRTGVHVQLVALVWVPSGPDRT
jgi:hypothetical protein